MLNTGWLQAPIYVIVVAFPVKVQLLGMVQFSLLKCICRLHKLWFVLNVFWKEALK